jgi:hypothetical protein
MNTIGSSYADIDKDQHLRFGLGLGLDLELGLGLDLELGLGLDNNLLNRAFTDPNTLILTSTLTLTLTRSISSLKRYIDTARDFRSVSKNTDTMMNDRGDTADEERIREIVLQLTSRLG